MQRVSLETPHAAHFIFIYALGIDVGTSKNRDAAKQLWIVLIYLPTSRNGFGDTMDSHLLDSAKHSREQRFEATKAYLSTGCLATNGRKEAKGLRIQRRARGYDRIDWVP